MSAFRHALNVPLALLAGAALASNPQLFGTDSDAGGSRPLTPVEAVRAQEPSYQQLAPDVSGRTGAESPELRALRLAEAELFAPPEAVAGRPAPRGYADRTYQDQAYQDEPWQDAGHDFLSGLNEPGIPVARHPSVEKYVNYFAANPKGRGMFASWLKRSGRYREIISEALRQQGLPEDLEAIVFVESGFWPTAESSAGAVGLWQFMPATARAYGLTVREDYDERRSPFRASEAAARHLEDLRARYNSWDLALAAYNFGYHNVENRLANFGAEDFWTLADQEGGLPTETSKYVPKVLAVAVLLHNLDHFGFRQEMDGPLRGVGFEVPPGTTLADLARAAGTSNGAIRQLNPEFVNGIVPDRGSPVVVHLPRDGLARARVMLPRLLGGDFREVEGSSSDYFDWGSPNHDDSSQGRLARTVPESQRHRMPSAPPSWDHQPTKTRGHHDSGSGEWNDSGQLARPPLRAAQDRFAKNSPSEQPDLPAESSSPLMSEAPELMSVAPELMSVEQDESCLASSAAPKSVVSDVPPTFVKHRVQPGDSIAKLAERFGVGERELLIDNRIRNPSLIYVGQTLKVRDTKTSPQRPSLPYKVSPGDSLSRIAAKLRASEIVLAQRNQIRDPNHIRAGQILLIPIE